MIKSSKEIIGFNDKLLMLLGIPVVSLLINTLLFGHLLRDNKFQLFSGCLPISLFYTATYWIVFRGLFFAMIRRYPDFIEVRKRQLITIGAVILGYGKINFVGNLVIKELFNLKMDSDLEPNPIQTFIASTVFSFLLLTLYESFYLSLRLGTSIAEKEMLLKENMSSQLANLRSQINPHFLFNSLNTLTALIHEDATRADNFVAKLSKVYRHLLENNEATLISLGTEIDYLRAYVHLLKERFGDNLMYQEEINAQDLSLYIVPLSLQITLENCVKHNIATKEKPLKVIIAVNSETSSITITNNLQELTNKEESTSVGLENIRLRYAYFTEQPIAIQNDGISYEVTLPLLKKIPTHKSQ